MDKLTDSAYPKVLTEYAVFNDGYEVRHYGDTFSTGGFTKFEKAALDIYANVLSVPEVPLDIDSLEKIAARCIEAAKILFEKLENEKEQTPAQ